jgi:Zn-dependent protease
MGDNTPAATGRLTLDPRKHIYWAGFLMFVIVGFGVLGAAPIGMANMNYPRVKWAEKLSRVQRFGLSVLAGPLGNLIVAILFAIPIRILISAAPHLLFPLRDAQLAKLLPSLGDVLYALVWWNVLLFVFNLIPLGPLDGRYILRMFLPPQQQYGYESFQNQYGMMILFGLIFLSFLSPQFNIFGAIIGGPTDHLTHLLLGI